jgi:DNA polymerase
VEQQRLERLVRQHAQTSRLLGVDFVPSYRRSGGAIEAKPAAEPVHAEPEPLPMFSASDASTPGLADTPDPAEVGAAALSTSGTPAERLDALRARYIADAPHRHFVTDHTNIVFGEGDPGARLMFIGEAPGAEEDRTGRPFVGKAGQLLDKMISAMGLRREQVYIANVLKTRPPNNATPTVDEARVCAPYLFEQIRIVSPEVIVTLGKSASQLLLSVSDSMSTMRGHWAQFPPPDPLIPVGDMPPIPVMPTFHPAYLLRSYTPENRAKVWSDLQRVMERLGLSAG